MSRFTEVKNTISYTYHEEGVYWALHKAKNLFNERITGRIRGKLATKTEAWQNEERDGFYDVIMINGCDYSVPHPIRYRVFHQLEQLEAAGYKAKMLDVGDLNDEYLRRARMFIIFRCPSSDYVKEFISKAKKLNKRVLYDIDDLVVSTEYTDTIPFVQQMGKSDKALYDDGVVRMGETLSLCDAAITTTEALAEELKKFVPRVYINRNKASEDMLNLSEEAVFRRDALPYLPDDQLPPHYKKIKKYWSSLAKNDEIVIGYFSGSITHNADFDIILPAIVKVMEERPNVRLLIGGELTLPEELERFADRVEAFAFCGWQRLVFHIAKCDINIAPLADGLFNRAKSENKWVEAALLKVPTVASRVGAFEASISDGETGLLCDNTVESWEKALLSLIDNPRLRQKIGITAYEHCRSECTTVYSSRTLKGIVERELTPNIAFVMPSMNISGGVLVALKHGCILQDRGYDVTFISSDDKDLWVNYEGHTFPVLNRHVPSGQMDHCPFHGRFDKSVATLWDTLDFIRRYPMSGELYYLVQNYETDFIKTGNPLRAIAEATYQNVPDVRYLTISEWCKNWMKKKYNINCRFARNGLDVGRFYRCERDWSGKVRVLIEGDCGSEYKNVDEAFRIAERLDCEKYDIWYMCYTGKKKDWYRIDKNLGRVPQEKVGDIYRQCHILLKTSKLESFSYPPLEMMSTGGCVVACPNGGNAEYLVDGQNCVLYEQGDIDAGVRAVERVASDVCLRESLIRGGEETAMLRDWSDLDEEIYRLYESESDT